MWLDGEIVISACLTDVETFLRLARDSDLTIVITTDKIDAVEAAKEYAGMGLTPIIFYTGSLSKIEPSECSEKYFFVVPVPKSNVISILEELVKRGAVLESSIARI